MKNIFRTLAIVALGFFATSCVSADVEDVQVAGGEGVVNFTVSTPGATSRAIADGKSATQLTCGVYDAQWNYLTKVDGQFDGSSLTTTVSIRLVNKKVYNFVFWAQDPDADCYTLTLEGEPNVAVTYNGVANDESRDAFFGQLTNLEVNGTMNEKVELTRPFAQINFGTLDTELAKVAGFDITVPEAKTTVTTRAYNTLYLGNNQHGAVGGAQDVQVTFSDAALPNEDLYLLNDTAHTTPYDWLSMNYILVPESESSLSECTLVVKDNKGQSVEVKYPSAPVKRNWRTNLVGNLLTDQVVIEVEILPIPEGEYNNEGTFASQLAAGGSILLKSNVVLDDNAAGLVIDKDTEIDLNGYTIVHPDTEASRASSEKAAMFTVEGDANLTIKNGKLVIESTNGAVSGTGTSTGAGNVVVFNSTGNLKIDDVTVEGSKRGGWRAVEVFSGSAVISNSTFNCYYGSAVNSSNADVTLNDCDITVTGMYSAPYNSVCFSVMNGGKLTVNGGNYKMINNNTFATGDTHGGWLGIVMNSGGTLILNDGIFENVPAEGFNRNYERAIIEAENLDPATAKVVFAGGKYKPQYNKVVSGYGDKEYPVLVGADKLADTDSDGWYTLEDNKGYVVDGDEYLVSTGAGFAAAVVDAPATANISLTADVDLTGVEYTPRSFSKLVFEGNNHTISGVKVENANQAALFGKTWNFDIKNVTLANSTFVGQNIDGEDAAAGFIGFYQAYSAGSKITNCHIENCTIGSAKYVGGLVAYKDGSNYSVAIDNCSVKNSTIVSKYTEDAGANYKGHVGGLVGYHAGDTATTITNCVVANNTFDVLGPRCGLFMGTAQMNIAVSGSVSGNAGLAQLCGAINKITDWSNVSVVYKVTSVDELNSALAQVVAGNPATIELAAGTYDTQNFQAINKTLCLKGIEDGVKIYISQNNDVACTSLDQCTVTFENLTIETLGGNYKGFARMNGTYKNCTIVNNYFTCYGEHVFDNCTFNAPTLTGSFKNEHCMWTYGAEKVVFNNCVFNYSDRCVNVYVDNGGNAPGITSDVAFTNCKFNTENTGSEGAVEINSSPFTAGVTVALDGCTAPAYGEMVYVSPWDGTKGATATIIVDGKITVTPANINSTTFTKSGSYKLVGDFSDTEKKEVVITTAEGANVVIDAEGATLPKHFVVKLNKYANNNNDVKRANGRKGNYTLRKFNTEVLSVGVTGTTVAVTECTLEYLDFWGGNAAVAITDNTIDGKGVKHERIDGNLHNYGIYIALINYDLSIERNSVTNTLSHAIGINGLTSTFREYASYNAYSTISSFTGNTLTKIGAYDNNRVGFKCWDDVTYAPTAAATIDDLPEAGKNLILAVDADATNVFSKDAHSSNNAYKFDFFDCKYAPLQ
ncbi:MAG: hypothetical protein IKA26_00790 [Alistipes sp.]|nr:hypothetical protein [Alistipes sp.]